MPRLAELMQLCVNSNCPRSAWRPSTSSVGSATAVFFSFFFSDKFGMERYLHKGLCLDACPEAFYHTNSRTCEPCSQHCQLCTSPNHCLKCNSSFYVSDGVCEKLECGEGKQGHNVTYERAIFLNSFFYSCDLVEYCFTCQLSLSQYPPRHTLCCFSLFSGEVEDPDYDDCMACEEGCRKCVLCKSI